MEHLLLQRKRLLGQRFLAFLVESFQIVILNLLQGVGKSHAVVKLIQHLIGLRKYKTIIVAVERLDKVQEYLDVFENGNLRKHYLIHARAATEKDCKHFALRQSYFSNGYLVLAEDLCDKCTHSFDCTIRKIKQDISRKTHVPKLIICTQKMLELSPILRKQIIKKTCITFFDEPGFITSGIQNYSKRGLEHILSVYEGIVIKNKEKSSDAIEIIATMARAGRLLLKRKFDEMVLFRPDYYTDKLLLEKGVPNIHSFLREAGFAEPLVDNDIKVVNILPLGSKVLIAAPISLALMRSKFKFLHGNIFELNQEILALKQPVNTHFFRIDDNCASDTLFPLNSDRIVDFFGSLILQRRCEGKKVLLIIKKRWKADIIKLLNNFFSNLGAQYRVVNPLGEIGTYEIPIVHFGIAGINDFEGYDCCYALSSYNSSESVLSESVDALHKFKRHVDFKIETNVAGRQITGYIDEEDRRDVQAWLEFHEDLVIRQALGRIRPFTNDNREVIYIHRNPVMPWEKRLPSLAAARTYFGVKTRAESKREAVYRAIKQDVEQGMKITDIAKKHKLNRTTIHRILKKEGHND